jgi:hypothetical protein
MLRAWISSSRVSRYDRSKTDTPITVYACCNRLDSRLIPFRFNGIDPSFRVKKTERQNESRKQLSGYAYLETDEAVMILKSRTGRVVYP